jgi:hypothetical protein
MLCKSRCPRSGHALHIKDLPVQPLLDCLPIHVGPTVDTFVRVDARSGEEGLELVQARHGPEMGEPRSSQAPIVAIQDVEYRHLVGQLMRLHL